MGDGSAGGWLTSRPRSAPSPRRWRHTAQGSSCATGCGDARDGSLSGLQRGPRLVRRWAGLPGRLGGHRCLARGRCSAGVGLVGAGPRAGRGAQRGCGHTDGSVFHGAGPVLARDGSVSIGADLSLARAGWAAVLVDQRGRALQVEPAARRRRHRPSSTPCRGWQRALPVRCRGGAGRHRL